MSFQHLYRLRELAAKPCATDRENELAQALQDALDDIATLRSKLENASDNLADIMRAARDAQKEAA